MNADPGRSNRLAALRAKLDQYDLGAILISQPENRYYLSGFAADDSGLVESSGHLLITASEALVLTDFRYQEDAAAQAPGFTVEVYRQGLADLLAELLPKLGVTRLGFESDYLVYDNVRRLKEKLDGVGLRPTVGLTAELRIIKDDSEVAAIEAALAVIEAVIDDLFDRLEPGLTERQAAWLVMEGLNRRGAGEAFETIVAAGENASKPHATPTDRPIRAGETIVIDAGARLNGYRSDITRTAWLGRPDDKFREVYGTVRRAQLAAIEGIVPGMMTDEADKLARQVIEAAGYGPYFGHSLGHGVGLATHESPSVSPLRPTELRPGMIHTIEPGIYLPGWGGIRLEVMAHITADKCRVLGGLDRFYEF